MAVNAAVTPAATAPSSASIRLTGPGTPPRELVRAVWAARPLIGVLARKDFLVRYRRTRLGLLWAVALPLLQAVVLAVVFSHIVGGVRSVGGSVGKTSSYAVFVFAGMVPWTTFSTGLSSASTAVVDGSNLARRIYFPRIVLPLVSVLTSLFPALITTVVLLVLELVTGTPMGVRTLWLIPGLLLAVALLTSLSVAASVIHVYVRDLRFLVVASLTVLFYATPVIYPLSRLPHSLRQVIAVLPTAGPVELFRRSLGAQDPGWTTYVVSTLVWTVVFGAIGFVLHCRRDRVMTDLM
jgi:lipopolysaccharide transport system permease protein